MHPGKWIGARQVLVAMCACTALIIGAGSISRSVAQSPGFARVGAYYFAMQVGGPNPLPQPLLVSAATEFKFSFSPPTIATDDQASWLRISPSNCTVCPVPRVYTISVDGSKLPAKTTPYHGRIEFNSSQIGSTNAVDVYLNIQAPVDAKPAGLAVFSGLVSELRFVYGAGQTAPDQTIQIPGPTPSSLPPNWTASTSGAPWIRLPKSATVASNSTFLTIGIVESQVPDPGLYSAQITVKSTSGITQTINVRLDVLDDKSAPVLEQMPPIGFVVQAGSPAPLPQLLEVNSSSPSPIRFGIGDTLTANKLPSGTNSWLTVLGGTTTCRDKCGTPFRYRIGLTTTNLAPGRYLSEVRIDGLDGTTSTAVAVYLTVVPAGTPVLNRLVSGLRFVNGSGSKAQPQEIPLLSSGPTELKLGIAPTTVNGGAWLKCTLSSDTTPATLNVNVVPPSQPGLYLGQVVITDQDTGNSSTLPIRLEVPNTKNPTFRQPQPINLTMQRGGQSPLHQAVPFLSTLGNDFNFAQLSIDTADGPSLNWLMADPENCSPLSCKTGSEYSVGINTQNLGPKGVYAAGVYVGSLTFTNSAEERDRAAAGSADLVVPVVLSVVEVNAPSIGALPSAIKFVSVGGTSTPLASQIVRIGTAGPGNLGVSYSIAKSNGDADWLRASLSGSTLTISVQPQGMSLGSYVGQILLKARSGNATLPVRLDIVGPTEKIFEQLTPLNPFTFKQDGSTPEPQTLSIASAGGTGNAFKFTPGRPRTADGKGWLNLLETCSPKCDTTANQKFTVSIIKEEAAKLGTGSYVAELSFTSIDGSSSLVVPVYLDVIGVQPITVTPGSLYFPGSGYQAVSVKTEGQLDLTYSVRTITDDGQDQDWMWASIPRGDKIKPRDTLTANKYNPADEGIWIVVDSAKLTRNTHHTGIVEINAPGASNGKQFVSVQFDVPSGFLILTNPTLPTGLIGLPYRPVQMEVKGADGPVIWKSDLPSALTGMSLSTDGVLSGTPLPGSTGSYSMKVTATSGAGTLVETKTFQLVIGGISLGGVLQTGTDRQYITGCNLTFSYAVGQDSPPPPVSCPFSSSIPGTFTVDQADWLQTRPFSGQISTNQLDPTVLRISVDASDSSVQGAGTYRRNLTIHGDQIGSLTIPATLIVTKVTSLVTDKDTLSFTSRTDASDPAPQTVSVFAPFQTKPSFEVIVDDNRATWLVLKVGQNATAPFSFEVSVNTKNLAAQKDPYKANILFRTADNRILKSIPVSLKVVEGTAAPRLRVDAPILNLSAVQGSTTPVSASIILSNEGGGNARYDASAKSGLDWLTLSPTSDTLSAASDTVVNKQLLVNATAGSLLPGTYQGSISIVADTTVNLNVLFTVLPRLPAIQLSTNFLSFNACSAVGGGVSKKQEVVVRNSGTGQLNYTLDASSTNSWLKLDKTNGTGLQADSIGQKFTAEVDSINARSLPPAQYSGNIVVTSKGASNSPQIIVASLTVDPPDHCQGASLGTNAMILPGSLAAPPPDQQTDVSVQQPAPRAVKFDASGTYFALGQSGQVATVQPDQPATVTVTPTFQNALPKKPVEIAPVLVTVDPTGQNPETRTISVVSIVVPPDAESRGRLLPRDTTTPACQVTDLHVQISSLSRQTFSPIIGAAVPIEVVVADECARLIGSGSVVATFSNRDRPVPLTHVGNGVWRGAWKPVGPGDQDSMVQITVTALSNDNRYHGSDSIQGRLQAAAGNGPVIGKDQVLNSASELPGPTCPGCLLTIRGTNLSSNQIGAVPSTFPRPTTFSGVRVFLGQTPLPLLYVSPTQINVQIPYDIAVDTVYQITVVHDDQISIPDSVLVVPLTPAIFADTNGNALSDPVKIGDTITLRCVGLGAVTPTVDAGTVPGSGSAKPVVTPTVMIGGKTAQLVDASLSREEPGVYAVRAIVPEGLQPGSVVPVTIQTGKDPFVVTSPSVNITINQ